MNVVVFEDEMPAFKRLSKLIGEVMPAAQIIAHLDSVKGGQAWLAANPCPDVIFMDVHLADGDAFDLLETTQVSCPIIFTTAYDQYALDAFKTSAIDYLLKPVKEEDLARAAHKLQQMAGAHPTSVQQQQQQQQQQPALPAVEYKKRFVIRYGEHICILATEQIAYFFSEHKATFARTFDAQTYPVDYNLDMLEPLLPPDDFFRVNRQYIIQLKAIGKMKVYSKGRVIINLNPPVAELPIVSSEKAARFKLWLADEH